MTKHSDFWNQAERQLRAAGLRVTPYRRQVIEAVLAATGPLTVAEIGTQLRRRPNRVTLYRLVEDLIKADILTQINFRHEQSDRFELADGLHQHHHHLVCEGCGTIKAVKAEPARPRVPRGFKLLSHQLEFYGLCAGCQGGAA